MKYFEHFLECFDILRSCEKKTNAFTFRHRLLKFLRDMPLADLPSAKNYTLFEPYTVLVSKDCRTNGSTCGAKVNHNFWRYHRNEKFGILWAACGF